MTPSTHSNMVIDPFSAIYKARPGELPSSLLIESNRHKRVGQQDALECEHPQSKRAQNVFCPSLAGESDRAVCKRMLIHPESLLPSPPMNTSASISPSSKLPASTVVHDLVDVNINPHRCGIFFSPPRSLDTLTSKRTRSENFTRSAHCLQPSEGETEATLRSESRHRFFSAFCRAIIRGDFCLDLDSQNLHTIPDLEKLVEDLKTMVSHLQDKVKLMALIKKMVNPSGTSKMGGVQQSLTPVKSAPSVLFAPRSSASLFLSNNQLTSSHFGQLDLICHFQGLEHLSLRSNRLTEIPEEIGQLKNLKLLNLAFNKLKFLPSSILKLTHCKLLLNGNPRLTPPLPLDSSSSLKPTLGNRTVQQLRCLSESQGVFYFSPHTKTLVPIDDSLPAPLPSLLETCIRKMCITKDLSSKNETLIVHDDDDDLDHNYLYPPSPSTKSPHPSTELCAVLPAQIQKIIKHPASYFYRCNLCTTKLVLKPDVLPHPPLAQTSPHPRHAFHFRNLGLHGLTPFPQQPQPHTPDQKIELNCNNLIPICWNICSLNCCIEHIITT
ncbi:hypothetical protein PGT21_017249 [Puccinia graminis f. sp. tritici]|uniref:Uncharacterized protein n=1 Tax=Puccinia graminis f. sp. tritici TaxID=56615 RepID=A0A5B0MXA7_PUCGR|nr:hypothetical protein PGT21_017249 [Puccinia graminis f. sp. tritici]KAA1092044.1 hypothetical protein PGTUg99_005629 [Puccinia graminis f. sp. tritici]